MKFCIGDFHYNLPINFKLDSNRTTIQGTGRVPCADRDISSTRRRELSQATILILIFLCRFAGITFQRNFWTDVCVTERRDHKEPHCHHTRVLNICLFCKISHYCINFSSYNFKADLPQTNTCCLLLMTTKFIVVYTDIKPYEGLVRLCFRGEYIHVY